MVDVTVVGDVNVDVLTSPISRYPKKDSQIRLEAIHLEVGGGGAHVAAALAMLGIPTALIGLVGKDAFGDFICKKIKELGVVSRLKRADERTGISIGISFKDGSRSLLTYRGTNRIFSLKHFRLEEIEGKILFVSGYNLMEKFQRDLYKVLLYAKKKGMLTCLEPDIKSGKNFDVLNFKKIIKLVDFFFPDFEEGRMLTGEKNEEKVVKKILGLGCKVVALKLGERGCIVAEDRSLFRVGAFEVNAVNPTGAGDFFNAGFIFGYLTQSRLDMAGLFGNAVASYAISRFGDERYPSRKEVKKLIGVLTKDF